MKFYLDKLKRHDGVLEQTIAKVSRAIGYHGFLFADIYPERGQAVTALILLKPLPTRVLSDLVTLSNNRNRQIAAAEHCALTIKEDELVFLHPPAVKGSLDLDLLNFPNVSEFEMMSHRQNFRHNQASAGDSAETLYLQVER